VRSLKSIIYAIIKKKMVVFNYFADLWDSYSLAVITAFTVFLFMTLILDGLKFSDVKFLRYAQYFMLSSLFLYLY
jgi:hypothetical protein